MYVVHPEVTISGPAEANFGSNVSIRCTVLKGNPSPSVFIITPQGEVIKESGISINATMKDAGNYTCIANNSAGTITSNLTLTVYGTYVRLHVFLIMKISQLHSYVHNYKFSVVCT